METTHGHRPECAGPRHPGRPLPPRQAWHNGCTRKEPKMHVRPALMRRRHERTGSRTRVRGLAVLAVLSAMAFLVPAGAASASEAAPLSGLPTVKIFLTNSRSFCADIRGNDNAAGGTVELYPCASSKSDLWIDLNNLQCGSGGNFICTEFVDSRNDTVCLAMNSARNVVLQACGHGGDNPSTQTEWLVDTGAENGWRNYDWGANGDLYVAAAKANDFLHGTNASAGCGGCWYRWSVS
jgi:hypothetical protein